MKSQDSQHEPRVSPAMIEDKAAEKRKKRAQEAGLIVIAGDGKATKPAGKKQGDKK